MITEPSRVPLRDRAWTGNGRFGALVSADGTMDWFCPGGIGADAVLWRLLDPVGGALRIGPVREGSDAGRRLPPSVQRYRPDTNVVETVLEGAGGRRVSVTDFFHWPGPGLEVSPRPLRVVRALSGPVDVEVEVYPSGPFEPAREVIATGEGVVVDDIAVRAPFGLQPAPVGRDTPRWTATRRLDEGDGFVVTIDGRLEPDGPPTVGAALRLADETASAWRSWLSSLAYSGPYRAAVQRSLLAVRSLTGPSGAPVAAATASLPRRPGGERTSDMRWVRWHDVAAAAEVLALAGFAEDAENAERWLRQAVSDAPLPWPAWLDPDGQSAPEVDELALEGWRRSQPVLTGVPGRLTDLDCYGAVVRSVGASRQGPGGRPGDPGPLSAARPSLSAVADWLTDHWADPDCGVWLSQGPPAMLVSSRLEAFAALERMARLAREADPLDLSAAMWQRESRAVLAWVDESGVASDGGLRRDGAPGAGEEPDASLLRVAWRGPWPAGHPVVSATVDRVLDQLGSSGLLYRYTEKVDDGRAGPDNPDLLASLWGVKALARLGRWEEAHGRMETVLALAGRTGLLSEAADPVACELMGNLPATSVHLALVDAALELDRGPA